MLAAVVLVAAFRLMTLGTFALTDNTEARYAEIGWQMFRSGDWVTPRLYMSGALVHFWAKPPLFFWSTALSFGAFGASEWAARSALRQLATAPVQSAAATAAPTTPRSRGSCRTRGLP